MTHIGRLCNYDGTAGIILHTYPDGVETATLSTSWQDASVDNALGRVELCTTSKNLAGVIVGINNASDEEIIYDQWHIQHHFTKPMSLEMVNVAFGGGLFG